MKKFVLSLILLSLSSFTQAKTVNDINFPDTLKWENTDLVLNGVGVRKATIFKVKVYVAGLYLAKKATTADEIVALAGPKVLEMHFVMSVEKEKLREAWESGYQKNLTKEEYAAAKDGIGALNKMMQTMKKGQIMLLGTNGNNILVEINGVKNPPITNEALAKNFFKVFVGNEPPNPELKDGLLGK
jgi:hypothetical protein